MARKLGAVFRHEAPPASGQELARPARHVLMLGRRRELSRLDDNEIETLRGGTRQLTLANALRLLLGLWIMDAPFIYAPLGISPATVWNDLICGGCVVMLATMRLVFIREARAFRIAHLLLGGWIALSPWYFQNTEDPVYFWNSLICGTAIAGLALWSLVRYRAA
jgi:hypothetical protein